MDGKLINDYALTCSAICQPLIFNPKNKLRMTNKQSAAVRFLRVTGIAEGISFLLLLGVAMPLKYLAGIPEMVTFVGWAHGLLLILYIAGIIWVREVAGMSIKSCALAFVASLLPFGTFYADKKIFSQLS